MGLNLCHNNWINMKLNLKRIKTNWKQNNDHKGNLFCSIGIDVDKDGSFWTWKEDCGTESNVEKQKGEASDAFKRAAVMWGIGRFLYSTPIIKLDSLKDGRNKWQPAFNGQILYGDKVSGACNYKLKNNGSK